MSIEILFRDGVGDKEEINIAKKYFTVKTSRMSISKDSIVIGRYSVLPYYNELCQDLNTVNSRLINSKKQHDWLEDCETWSEDLSIQNKYIPKVYSNISYLPDNKSFVLKGKTNSRKQMWNTHMFARNKKDAIAVAQRLMEDSLLSSQGIVAKEYMDLETFGISIGGLPIVNEWRTFWVGSEFSLKPKFIAKNYYFSNSHPEFLSKANFTEEAEECANYVAGKISEYNWASFYSIDVAQLKGSDSWIVTDINDGQMSGLCGIDPETFYSRLSKNKDFILGGKLSANYNTKRL